MTDSLQNGLVGSPCSPRDSQESSPTPQFKSINSSAGKAALAERAVRADPFDVCFQALRVDQRFAAGYKPPILRHHAQICFRMIERALHAVIEVFQAIVQFLFRQVILFLERIRPQNPWARRSEERRVGKECRSRWSPY